MTPSTDREKIEAVARAAYKADVIARNAERRENEQLDLSSVDFDKWWNDTAAMPLSGPGFVRGWEAIAVAAIEALEAIASDEVRKIGTPEDEAKHYRRCA